MRHRSATIVRHAEAPIEQVRDLLARTGAWPHRAPIRQARLERRRVSRHLAVRAEELTVSGS